MSGSCTTVAWCYEYYSIHVYNWTDCEHENHNADPTQGISEELKSFICEKFSDGMRTSEALLALIRRNNTQEPRKSKLVNFLRTLRSAWRKVWSAKRFRSRKSEVVWGA